MLDDTTRQAVTRRRVPGPGRRALVVAALAAALVSSGHRADAHVGGIEIRSTTAGGGKLVVSNFPAGKLALVQSACAAGTCLFTNSDVAFLTPDTDLADPVQSALPIATVIRLELVAADAASSVKVGNSVLATPGQSLQLGVSWSLHAHPVFQVTAPQATTGTWSVTVKLTVSNSADYSTSAPMTFTVTNLPATTTTTQATTTTTDAASCGDSIVGGNEECDPGPVAWVAGRACSDQCTLLACADTDGDGKRGITDALFVLRVATGSRECDACLCNVDASTGATPVGVSDALKLLRFAVGLAGAELQCAPCN